MLNYSCYKNEGMCRSGEGEEGPLCDPRSELLVLRRSSAREYISKCEENIWDKGEKKIEKKRKTRTTILNGRMRRMVPVAATS